MKAPSAWRRRGGAPLVLGHRGARREAPENTLTSFALAMAQGAAGVELDVRLSGGSEVIVLHDRMLGRITSGADVRDVETLSRAELSSIRIEGEPIPELAEVLQWALDGDVLLNIELKRDVGSRRALTFRVAKLLRALPAAKERVLLSSFDPAIVRVASMLVPDVPVAWLVHAEQPVLKRAPGWKRLGAVGVNPELALCTTLRVRGWLDAGALVSVWTVNEPDDARRLAALGVDALISDVPRQIVEALG